MSDTFTHALTVTERAFWTRHAHPITSDEWATINETEDTK